jgi:phage antirepressor YoqD-like protein
MLARVKGQIQSGATATMKADSISYYLEIGSGNTMWQYSLDRNNFSVQESSRWVNGKQLEITRYTAFHANGGVTTDLFKF